MTKAKQTDETVNPAALETLEKAGEEKKTCVYCGPSVRGVVRQYTVYAGEIPAVLKEFISKHPLAKGLLVPVERFAQTRQRLETPGTTEAILYRKIQSEL